MNAHAALLLAVLASASPTLLACALIEAWRRRRLQQRISRLVTWCERNDIDVGVTCRIHSLNVPVSVAKCDYDWIDYDWIDPSKRKGVRTDVLASYLYIITNNVNGKCYVGKGDIPSLRFADHMQNSCNTHLRNAVKLYGRQAFDFFVVEEWPTVKRTYEAETELIAYFRWLGVSLYNVSGGGEGAGVVSVETKAKLRRITQAQFLDPVAREKHRLAVRQGLTPDVIRRAVETRVRNADWHVALSVGQNKRFEDDEEHTKISRAVSASMTPERRAEIGDRHRGKVETDETRQRKSAAAKGKSKSPQHRENMRRAQARLRLLKLLRKRLNDG